jgi:hypothetical protein
MNVQLNQKSRPFPSGLYPFSLILAFLGSCAKYQIDLHLSAIPKYAERHRFSGALVSEQIRDQLVEVLDRDAINRSNEVAWLHTGIICRSAVSNRFDQGAVGAIQPELLSLCEA